MASEECEPIVGVWGEPQAGSRSSPCSAPGHSGCEDEDESQAEMQISRKFIHFC